MTDGSSANEEAICHSAFLPIFVLRVNQLNSSQVQLNLETELTPTSLRREGFVTVSNCPALSRSQHSSRWHLELGETKKVYVDGTSVPLSTVKTQMKADYSFPGGTPNLPLGMACRESRFRQFSTTTLKSSQGPTIPLLLWGINACWPNQSYDGGSHIGITQVPSSMDNGFDWLNNTYQGVTVTLVQDKIGSAQRYETQKRNQYPALPALTTAQTENNALFFYLRGQYRRVNGQTIFKDPYYMPNNAGTGWILNPNDPGATGYVNQIRANLSDPNCQ